MGPLRLSEAPRTLPGLVALCRRVERYDRTINALDASDRRARREMWLVIFLCVMGMVWAASKVWSVHIALAG